MSFIHTAMTAIIRSSGISIMMMILMIVEVESFGCDLAALDTAPMSIPTTGDKITGGHRMSLDLNIHRNDRKPTFMHLLADGTIQLVICMDADCRESLPNATNLLKSSTSLLSTPGDVLLFEFDNSDLPLAVVDGVEGFAGSIVFLWCTDSVCENSVTTNVIAMGVNQHVKRRDY